MRVCDALAELLQEKRSPAEQSSDVSLCCIPSQSQTRTRRCKHHHSVPDKKPVSGSVCFFALAVCARVCGGVCTVHGDFDDLRWSIFGQEITPGLIFQCKQRGFSFMRAVHGQASSCAGHFFCCKMGCGCPALILHESVCACMCVCWGVYTCTSRVGEMRAEDAGLLVQIFGTSVIAGVCVSLCVCLH